jgi:hypothetical protein
MAYDVAQICENGHVINSYHTNSPEHDQNFCDACGAPTITECPTCHVGIRGNVLHDYPNLNFMAPSFCIYCGNPFPWTQTKISAATQFANELESIDEGDKAVLITSIIDLVKDTPSTPMAIVKFKKIMVKVGTVTASVFREILVDVLSEATKRALFP